MNDQIINDLNDKTNIIDPIIVLNKYAAFSTFNDDIIFSNKTLIFCGGIIQDIGKNVYYLKEKDFVGYISFKNEWTFKTSSQLVFKFTEIYPKLIFILPYDPCP